MNELNAKAKKLKALKAKEAEIAEQITAIEDEIKAEMTERGVEELSVGVLKIRWTKVVSNRLDTTALKKAIPDIVALFTKPTETRRFTIA
jgi:predicted phage-related endonuclease